MRPAVVASDESDAAPKMTEKSAGMLRRTPPEGGVDAAVGAGKRDVADDAYRASVPGLLGPPVIT
jgi:hypothetical protein